MDYFEFESEELKETNQTKDHSRQFKDDSRQDFLNSLITRDGMMTQQRGQWQITMKPNQRKNTIYTEIISQTDFMRAYKFHVPISQIRARQDHMKKIKENAKRNENEWNGSILLKEMKEEIMWSSELTKCICLYYETGYIHVPDEVSASSVLLALSLFNIIYCSDQLMFKSFGSHFRFKMWTDYYTHRPSICQWIVKKMMASHSRHSHVFVTSPEPYSGTIYLGRKRCEIMDGKLNLTAQDYDDTTVESCTGVFIFLSPLIFFLTFILYYLVHKLIIFSLGFDVKTLVIHDLFNDNNQFNEDGESIEGESRCMRENFQDFLQDAIVGTRVTFKLREVSVLDSDTRSRTIDVSSVLRIDCISINQKKRQIRGGDTKSTTSSWKNDDLKNLHRKGNRLTSPRSILSSSEFNVCQNTVSYVNQPSLATRSTIYSDNGIVHKKSIDGANAAWLSRTIFSFDPLNCCHGSSIDYM